MVSCDFDLLTCYFVHKKNPQPKKPTRVSKKNPTKNPTPDFFLKKKTYLAVLTMRGTFNKVLFEIQVYS